MISQTGALKRRATTTHGEIAWDVYGGGPSVLLVHGTPSRSVLWRNVVPDLAGRFTVYIFDLLGFGESERSETRSCLFACTPRCSPNSFEPGTSTRLLSSATISVAP